MCMGSPSIPSAPPPPPPPAPAPTLPDSGVQAAGTDAKTKAIAAIGASQTVTTTPAGLVGAASTTGNSGKSLLGS